MKRKVKVNIDGVEDTRTLEQILRDAQKAGAADKRLREANELLAHARETVPTVAPSPAPSPPPQATSKARAKQILEAVFSGDEEAATELLSTIIEAQQAPAPQIDAYQLAQQVKQSMSDDSALKAVAEEYPEVFRNDSTKLIADRFYNRAIADGKANAEAYRFAAARTYEEFGITKTTSAVTAGILKASDLAGWRNDQVFIRGALHVPLSKEAVRECMPVFFELLAAEPHPAARAVLGHFFFVYIHPYMDGNGRLARFIFNSMLVTGGYDWTIVPLEQRKPYMAALEQASSYGNVLPLAKFFADLLREQSETPLPRPKG